MSYLNLGNYNDEVANISSQYTNLLSKADESFDVKEKANQITEAVGSIKAFTSGKPISKYLISKGKDAIKGAVEKAGVQLKNVRTEFQSAKDSLQAIPKTENIIGKVGSQLNAEGVAPETIIATPLAPDVIASPIPGGGFGSTTYAENATSRIMGSSGLTRNMRPPTPENLQPPNEEDSGILKQGSEETENVEKVAKSDEQYDKSLAKDDRGKGEKGEEEEEDVGGDTEDVGDGVAGALDAVPGPTEILGLLIGAGLAIGSAIHKPKEIIPVDKINASYQVGV